MACITAGAMLFASMTYVSLNANEWHKKYLRYKVGQNVVRIIKLDEKGELLGGGTGFAVVAPSGNTYLVTNAHVCEVKDEAGNVMVQLANGNRMPRRVIQVAQKADLCLLEGIPGYDGLEVGSPLKAGDWVAVVGHPQLMDLVISSGNMVAQENLPLLKGIIGWSMKEEDCNAPNDEIKKVDTIFGELNLCLTNFDSYKTTVVTLPGNSGSPAVDAWGNVVGVLFAGPGGDGANWGSLVTRGDLKDFLAAY